MTPLRAKMIESMQVRNFAAHTQEAYVRAVAGLAGYYHRSPDQITCPEVQHYLHHLIVDHQQAWSTSNVAVSAFRFFYTKVLGWEGARWSIPARKKESRLPEILSAKELERLFAAPRQRKHRVLLMTAYAGGLRVSELVRLKVTDIDSARGMIRVEQAKGHRDRYTLLSERLLAELREYWRLYRPALWLFPGPDPARPIREGTAQKIYDYAKQRAGLLKGRGIHTLRHCFATHLLEAGVDVAVIQKLLGHRSVATTLRYVQVTRSHLETVRSPLDLLHIPALRPRP